MHAFGDQVRIIIFIYFFAFIIYLYFGLYTYNFNRKSFLNKLFLLLCVILSIWTLSVCLMNLTSNRNLLFIYYKISAIGWCFMHVLVIHYILIITKKKYLLSKWWIYPLIYSPSVVFFYFTLNEKLVINEIIIKYYGSTILDPKYNFLIYLYILYHLSYFITYMILIIAWGKKSHRKTERKQSFILASACLVSYVVGTLTDLVFPMINIIIPSISPLALLFFIFGVWYATIKYNFMKIVSNPIAFEEIISRMMDLLIVFNKDGTIAKVNNKVGELLDFKENELYGTNIGGIVDEKDFCGRIITLHEKENRYLEGEVNFITKSGIRIPVSFSSAVINDDEGEIGNIAVIGHDIRLTKQLQLEINERIQSQIKEEKYIADMKLLSKAAVDYVDFPMEKDVYRLICEKIHNIVDGNFVVIQSYDPETGYLTPESIFYENNELDGNFSMFGINPFSIKYQVFDEFREQFISGKLFKSDNSILEAAGLIVSDEFFGKFMNEYRLSDFYLMGLTRNNELLGLVAIMTRKGYQITNMEIVETLINLSSTVLQRRFIEKELKESEERYRRLVSQIPDVIMIIKDENVSYINESVKNFLGFMPDEIIGTSIYKYIYEQFKPVLFKNIKRLLSGEIVQDYEIELMTKYFERKVGIIRSSVFIYNNEPVILAVISDITERKKYEIELSRAKDIAENANKAKSEFLATMSHEVRTPINGILGMINLAFLTELNKEQKNYLGMAKSSAEYLIQIVDEVLDFSRIEAGKLELEKISFNIRTLVSTTIDELSFKAVEKKIGLRYHVDPAINQDLIGDPGRLKQILVNLVWNAIKFTDNGEVFLGIEMNNKTQDGVELKFIIRDTGIGISDDKKGKLFKSFSQGDSSSTRKYGGAGLGLAISKRLTEMMNGEIWFESRERRGTTFFFTATFITEKVSSHTSPEPKNDIPVAEIQNREIRILLAEDNTINQEFLNIVFKKKGWLVECVNNGEDAVYEASKHEFDLILMDIEMPVMDGLEASKILRARGNKIPIIALTAYAMKGDREKCLDAGMNDYIAKPIKLDELFKKINILLKII
jgi:PAS domain S-box-containing protein